MQIQRVLVAVDFSPLSTLAVNYAAALARKFGAKLTLLHVVESPSALVYTFPIGTQNLVLQQMAQAERMLPAFIGQEDQAALDAQFLVRMGEVSEEIETVIREQNASILVMGTHGRGFFGRLFVGSVAQALLRKIPVPVLTVCHAGQPLEFKRLLYATDFSDVSDDAFHFALDLAEAAGSSLVVAHVVDKRPRFVYEPPQVAAVFKEERRIAAQEAKDRFAGFVTEGLHRNVKVETVLSEGVPSDAIVRIADETAADFIVLQVRKRGRLDRTVLGSTAEPVIREARIPVLCVPAGVSAYELAGPIGAAAAASPKQNG